MISHDSEVCGVIAVADIVRKESIEAIKEIKDAGIKNIIMLTGDNWRTARAIAEQVGIDNVEAELMPEDKVKGSGINCKRQEGCNGRRWD